jgi:hypothetical protein
MKRRRFIQSLVVAAAPVSLVASEEYHAWSWYPFDTVEQARSADVRKEMEASGDKMLDRLEGWEAVTPLEHRAHITASLENGEVYIEMEHLTKIRKL